MNLSQVGVPRGLPRGSRGALQTPTSKAMIAVPPGLPPTSLLVVVLALKFYHLGLRMGRKTLAKLVEYTLLGLPTIKKREKNETDGPDLVRTQCPQSQSCVKPSQPEQIASWRRQRARSEQEGLLASCELASLLASCSRLFSSIAIYLLGENCQEGS